MPDDATVVGDRDGGVTLRLGRRCRLAASILLVIGAGLLLAVALTSWGVISAVATLVGGSLVIGAALLARRAALWSATRRSAVAGLTATASENGLTQQTTAGPATADDLADLRSTAPRMPSEPMTPAQPATPIKAAMPTKPAMPQKETVPAKPAVFTATVGPPRALSPGRPGAPIKRRLGAAVVPVVVAQGSAPGDGALIVHARADGEALAAGDRVQVWPAAHGGRFVMHRDSDGQVFVATTRLTDTW